jgi:hypothetical protein
MFIKEFHSKLVARKEQTVLFDALRRLRLLDDPKRMVMANSDGDGDGGDSSIHGWTVWGDASGSGTLAHGSPAGA